MLNFLTSRWFAYWEFDPVVLLNLLLLAWLYGRGVSRMRHAPRVQAACFVGAMAMLLAALASPLAGMSHDLAWAHMTQHMLLMVVAAPLLVLARPLQVILAGWPRRRMIVRTWYAGGYAVGQPVAAWMLFAVTLWIWHWPWLYEAALASRVMHDVQHATFFAAAFLFWQVVFDPIRRLRMARPLAVLYLFLASLHASLLGVFMTLATSVWYPSYQWSAPAWGITPLEDQQLAGLVMWMPGCLIYAVAAAGVLAAWLREAEGSQKHENVESANDERETLVGAANQ